MASPHRILVALSGGVDSAVAALRLQEAGHEVAGAYMRTWMNESADDLFADCPWEEDIRQAQAVARHLRIDFEVVDLIREYRERVVEYLVDGYRRGLTPNPDIMCNREMKFGVFREFAARQGFAGVATGHYARIERNEESDAISVREGRDPAKDQSYFLALVKREQFANAHFPVGEMLKAEVRECARERRLPNAERRDSQGICFLGKVDIRAFLERFIEDRPGPIVHAVEGRVLGEHRGLHRFTIGQRHGIGVPSNMDNEHYVVVAKDFETNSLRVAFDRPDAPGLWTREALLHGLNWIGPAPDDGEKVMVKPRYRDPPQAATLVFEPTSDAVRVEFHEAQRGLAVGQIAAIYKGKNLLGGGIYR